MDPTQTLIDLLQAIADGDRQGSRDHLTNLNGWIAKGGYIPESSIYAAIEELKLVQRESRGEVV